MTAWSTDGDPYRPQSLPVHGCEQCGGVWIEARTLTALLKSASQIATQAPEPQGAQVQRRTLARGAVNQKVVYRKCPACAQAMHRKNFARVSGVIVDRCRHGTFFDRGELEEVLTFVRTGGLALSQRQEQAERAREHRQRAAIAKHKTESVGMGPMWLEAGQGHDASFNAFADWASHWVRRTFGS